MSLIPKSYPSYVDVYAKVYEVDWETGETIDGWDYENPMDGTTRTRKRIDAL